MWQVVDSFVMRDYLLSVMATSSHLRRINQRKIVHSMLRLHCSASRTKLAEIAGMSQATVGRIVDDLITQSILAEVDTADYPVMFRIPPVGTSLKTSGIRPCPTEAVAHPSWRAANPAGGGARRNSRNGSMDD